MIAKITDGTPLVLLERDARGASRWREHTLARMRIQETDVMFAARDHGLKTLQDIDQAILERNGDISILAAHDEPST